MRILARLLIFPLLLAFSYRLSVVVSSKNEQLKAPVTIETKGRGAPHVNFESGRALNLGRDASKNQPVALVTADFDSDGIADVVTVDTAGNLQLLKGLDRARFALDPATKSQAQPEPFIAMASGASLNISPDFLLAGDFNADGKADIIGAASGAGEFLLVSGDGHGHFSQPLALAAGGEISAIESGEIGRPDGQADLAVAYTNKEGSFVAIYEHPESAFKHPPEIFKLPSAANAIAIGNMDEDFYADVAVACGSDLVIIHGRGQAYPWDIVKGSGIARPPAVVETRIMPFSITSIAVGRFGERRGTSLALLGGDGNIYRLEPTRQTGSSNNKIATESVASSRGVPFMPTDAAPSKYALMGSEADLANVAGQSTDSFGNALVDYNELKMVGRDEYFKKRQDEIAASATKNTPEEMARITADIQTKRAEMDTRRKAAFINSISSRSSAVKDWSIETLSDGSRFAAMAAGSTTNNPAKLMRVNVSDGNLDDLMVTSSGNSEIQFVSRQKNANRSMRSEVSSISGTAGTRAVLPVRLNLDGLDDLVVLRDGASAPSVVISAPQAVFSVNNTLDDNICDPSPGPCSLRGAILAANGNPGVNIIAFAISNSTSVINLQTQLPPITHAISIQGGALPDGTKLIEINGSQIGGAADGLKIRASNCFIWNLAINQMPRASLGNGSYTGGNGITVETPVGFPRNGHNTLVGLYLGTDATGNIKRPNASTGMLIFDSDENAIGGGGSFQNVMSGNDQGYGLDITVGNSNSIHKNIIGLNAAGNAAMGNANGTFLSGADNQFGGDNQDDGNTVSGNGVPLPPPAPGPGLAFRCRGDGVYLADILDSQTNTLLTLNNSLKGNRVGLDPTGTQPFGNCLIGISTEPFQQTTIGSITETGRNTISDNGWVALRCEWGYDTTPGGTCAIAGNNIGTDVTGNTSIPNDSRNFLSGLYRGYGLVDLAMSSYSYSYFGAPGGTTPNGACTGFCNLYSGNSHEDVHGDINAVGNATFGIFNNSIGVKKAGNEALPNVGGVSAVSNGDLYIGGVGDDNGTPISLGNLISGQIGSAMYVGDSGCGGSGNTVVIQGNKIGTDATGVFAIPNGPVSDQNFAPAVEVARGFAGNGTFGGEDPLAQNIISGNIRTAVGLDGACRSGPIDMPFSNNLVGVNVNRQPLGNGGSGLTITASSAVIGGSPASANEIAYNGSIGVWLPVVKILPGTSTYYGTGASIRYNSIHDNNGLGIDLGGFQLFGPPPNGPDGVTANDTCDQDADLGPNLLQNFPELRAPVFNSNGTVTVEGILKSAGRQHYFIDFYSNSVADVSGHGEGETPIGTTDVTSDGNGFASFTFTSTGSVASSVSISATATDDYGNTSEFSCNAGGSCSSFSSVHDLKEYMAAPQDVCPPALIVNLASDEEDGNLADGFCDINPNNSDNHECTLRAALQIVTQPGYVGTHTITFDIPGAGVQTITPGSPLPTITTQVNIDGASQHAAYIHVPRIELNGINAGATDGLVFAAGSDGSNVSGMAINRFFNAGVRIASNNNVLVGCYIGVLADGVTPDPNSRQNTGVSITGSGNRIGGTTDDERNILSLNRTDQVLIDGTSAVNNTVVGNYIGILADRNASSGENGVQIANGATDNKIGGHGSEENNIGGLATGVFINRANGNFVVHNTIEHGVYGIRIQSSSNNIIGGDDRDGFRNISGNSIYENSEAGILIANLAGDDDSKLTTNNRVMQNYIGNIQGSPAPDPQKNGVVVGLATGNFIGGGTFVNLISGNTEVGVRLQAAAVDNEVRGNYVGISLNGDGAFANNVGIEINGNRNRLRNNLISGNRTAGVVLERENAQSDPPQENRLFLNRIGLDRTGNLKIANMGTGVIVDGINNYIGDSGGRNWISGNLGFGVNVLNDGNHIGPNTIGLNKSGNAALGNFVGIAVEGSSNTTIDGSVVSGNSDGGIVVASTTEHPGACQSTVIRRNYVGTDVTGSTAIPNGSIGSDGKYRNAGIQIRPGASNSIIGGSDGSSANVISGNDGPGITVGIAQENPPAGTPLPTGTRIQGNFIGTDVSGTNALANRGAGIFIEHATDTLIGGFGNDIPSARNIISANGYSGIDITSTESSLNRVSGNYIGTAADGVGNLGNHLAGVLIRNGAHHNTVGGTEENAGNKIDFNQYGVVIADFNSGVVTIAGCCNKDDPNSTLANLDLGISLGCQLSVPDEDEVEDLDACSGAPLPNDPGDADSGPNNLQNYPEFVSALIAPNGDLVLTYKVDSNPNNSNYGSNGLYVEFFKGDASPNPSGQTFLGNANYTQTNYLAGLPGLAVVDLGSASSLGVHTGDKIVATATDADGNTSEFTGVNVGVVVGVPTAADGTVNGKIADASGAPLAGVTINLSGTESRERITDSQGNYHFDSVETNGFYTVTPARAGYTFTPANRSFSLLGAHTEASFTANANTGDNTNAIDTIEFFVRQQYLDFLNREPDEAGFNFWVKNIESCGGDAGCRELRRMNTSAAFLLSIEFQQTGFQVVRMYKATFIDTPARPRGFPRYGEFLRDSQEIRRAEIVRRGYRQEQSSDSTLNFARAWVQRPEVLVALPDTGASADQFVDKLFANSETKPTASERSAAVTAFGAGGIDGRARALLSVTASGSVINKQYNQAFVLMQYLGYLRRNPNDAPNADYSGFDFWLNKLNAVSTAGEDVRDPQTAERRVLRAQIVTAFIVSTEYRQRFGQP